MMGLLKNKKASHVGMVFSFVIFITFLIFVYDILAPAIVTDENKEKILEEMKPKLIEIFSANLTTTTISVKNASSGCFEIVKSGDISNINSIVGNGDILIDSHDGNTMKIKSTTDPLIKIYSSTEIISSTSPLSDCESFLEPNDYKIVLFRTKKYVFESKIRSFVESFSLNYNRVKEDLGVPIGTEIAITFEDSEKNIIGGTMPDIEKSVFAERITINYIDAQANIKPGFININIW